MAPDDLANTSANTLLHVSVAWCVGAADVRVVELDLPHGATVASALQASTTGHEVDRASIASLNVGVWGRRVELSTLLRDQDRVEVYRPLLVDPKEARRLRYRHTRRR